MRKHNKLILLTLLLGTVSTSYLPLGEAALLGSGTHDVIGNYGGVNTLVVGSDSDTTLNATGNVTLYNTHSNANVSYGTGTLLVVVTNATTNINMKGHDLAINTDFVNIRGNADNAATGTVNINNAGAFTMNSDSKGISVNAIYLVASEKVNISANTIDISCTGKKSTYPAVFLTGAGSQLTMKAAGDVNLSADAHGYATTAGKIKVSSSTGNVNVNSYRCSTFATGGGSVDITAAKDISLTSDVSNTIYNDGGTTTLIAGNDINVTNNGTPSIVGTTSTLKMTAQKGDVILTGANNSHGFQVAGGNTDVTAYGDIVVQGTVARGIRATSASTANFTSENGTIKITATKNDGASNMGIGAYGKSTVGIHGNAVIDAVTDNIIADDGSTITFDKGLIATQAENGITATNGSTVTATDRSTTKQLKGDIKATTVATTTTDEKTHQTTTTYATSTVDMAFPTAESYFIGAANGDTENINSSTMVSSPVTLYFNNAAVWKMTGDSDINTLSLNGDSYLNMNYTGTGTYENLRTQNLTGTTGHIMMSTDLQSSKDAMNVQGNSDRIKIIDGSSGTYVVDIADASSLKGTAAEGYLLLIEDAYWKDKDYNNMATFVGGNLRKGGIFKYKPVITNVDPDAASGYSGVTTDQRPTGCGGPGLGHNPPCPNINHVWTKQSWYLTASEKTDEITESTKPVLGSASARYMSYWRELDTLLQRLGELRQDEKANGIWVRYRHGEQSVDNVGVKNSTYNMAQLGYDYQTSKSKNGARNLLGLAFNHTWGDEEYINAATGSSGANVFSLYDTWLGNKGHYWDIVGKVGRIYKDFTYAGDDYLSVPDSASDGGLFYSIGMEYGRKKMLGDKGWYAEPQAQLTYGRINSTDYTTDQFVDVHTGAMNSLIGRMGVTLGREITGHTKNQTNIYGKIFWNREFRGDLSTHMSDSYGDTYDHTDDYTGNWLTAGFGITGKINKNQNIYIDLEKTFGGQINTKWQWQAGYRLMW